MERKTQTVLPPFFPFFLFPSSFQRSSPRYFLQFSSNRTLRVMSRGLLNTSRLRSVRPFLSPLEKKSKRWEEWREGWRENWWLLLLEYKYEYTRECIISRKRSRTDVNVTASLEEQNRFSRKWGSRKKLFTCPRKKFQRNHSSNGIPTRKRNCAETGRVFVTIKIRVKKKKKKRKTQMKREGRLYYELEAKSVSWWLCGREMRTASLLRFEIRMHSGWLLSPASDMYAGDVNTGFGILRQ